MKQSRLPIGKTESSDQYWKTTPILVHGELNFHLVWLGTQLVKLWEHSWCMAMSWSLLQENHMMVTVEWNPINYTAYWISERNFILIRWIRNFSKKWIWGFEKPARLQNIQSWKDLRCKCRQMVSKKSTFNNRIVQVALRSAQTWHEWELTLYFILKVLRVWSRDFRPHESWLGSCWLQIWMPDR